MEIWNAWIYSILWNIAICWWKVCLSLSCSCITLLNAMVLYTRKQSSLRGNRSRCFQIAFLLHYKNSHDSDTIKQILVQKSVSLRWRANQPSRYPWKMLSGQILKTDHIRPQVNFSQNLSSCFGREWQTVLSIS